MFQKRAMWIIWILIILNPEVPHILRYISNFQDVSEKLYLVSDQLWIVWFLIDGCTPFHLTLTKKSFGWAMSNLDKARARYVIVRKSFKNWTIIFLKFISNHPSPLSVENSEFFWQIVGNPLLWKFHEIIVCRVFN